ncbi:hypothetical protein B0H17DRAFT_1148727 [Mycena rosella]|uniref:Uncharacterized protein n=1 Tax=Mycena rosella TaxID=1033263 RepID=A0AAD7C9L3_MYCRO|nr:hypothetical protein B0H17DRAFT_1148727 [Mycena rosella]
MPFVHAVYRRRTVLLRRQFYADQLTAVAPDLTCTHSMQVIFRQPTVSLGNFLPANCQRLHLILSASILRRSSPSRIYAQPYLPFLHAVVAPDLTCIHSTQVISRHPTVSHCAWLYFLYAGNFPPPDCAYVQYFMQNYAQIKLSKSNRLFHSLVYVGSLKYTVI